MRSWLLQSGLQIVADMENHKRGYLGVAYAHLCFNLAGMLSDFGLHDRALAFNHKALAARVSLSVQIRTTLQAVIIGAAAANSRGVFCSCV